ncbi:Cytochrome b-c1 complex subunit 7 [Mitosporidium daphniae]|uniref:Complex III subunit 7 n=1 Tax=Mitosporidium daphniae TaxID=1485682 RepID=A0A098VUK2_9MICR|nr:subunit 7 of cytochrome b-c1 complex [Mitosporidium daphniae]KGG52524.1 subunit 7 of cytochrome b-c1 complex [Mitosporidium daphniae]|eukprot:XP_013238960.1 subunit 7 of cytochrome b-c1 complex [Mitosporidium daphniae]
MFSETPNYYPKVRALTKSLYVDDIIDTNHPVVMEAISRLSEQEQFDRTFRIRRAIHLHMKHERLSREEWTKPEEDRKYLWPIIEAICKERDERSLMDKLSSTSELRSQMKSFLEKKA